MSENHGKFVWYELLTTDTAGAAKFYGEVIGWAAKDFGLPDLNYTLLSIGDDATAGLMELPEPLHAGGVKPGWTGYVAVDDVDATTALAERHGAKTCKAPEDIPMSAGSPSLPIRRGLSSPCSNRHRARPRIRRKPGPPAMAAGTS